MNVIKLTQEDGNPVLIGIESIIYVKVCRSYVTEGNCTDVCSRHAMAISHKVTETVDEVYNLIKQANENN